MKNRVGFCVQATVALLAVVACAAQAFTLGDLRGTAVIGRALDVSVQLQASTGEDLSATCVGADVYFADTKQPAPTVTLSGVNPNQSTVRVQSSGIVNEPVVTVLMRSTCGPSTMRRYVLLADFAAVALPLTNVNATPTNTTVQPTLLVLPSTASTPATTPPEVSVAAVVTETKKEARSKRSKSKKTAVASDTAATNTPTPYTPTKKPGNKPSGQSVLKLDPLDILSDRIDLIESPLLFAPTEDALKQGRDIGTLQDDVKALRDLAAKNDAKLAELRAQLLQAQSQQAPLWLVFVLALLVLICMATIAWLWWQQRRFQRNREPAWWQEADDDAPSTLLMPSRHHPGDDLPDPRATPSKSTPPAPEPVKPVASAPTPAPATTQPPKPVKAAPVAKANPTPPKVADAAPALPPEPSAPEVDLDIDLDHFMLSDPKSPEPARPTTEVTRATIHHINVEHVLDLRQQAEFFVSLGQTDRALRILKKQISEATEPNPLVYLDLLVLNHSLGLKADFRELRDTFGQLFNATVPDFPAFNLPSKDLESYPEVMADLTTLWPGLPCLAFLDACIFHDPQARVRPAFELDALRDLLLLHGLSEELSPGVTSTVPVVAMAPSITVAVPEVAPTIMPGPAPVVSNAELPEIPPFSIENMVLERQRFSAPASLTVSAAPEPEALPAPVLPAIKPRARAASKPTAKLSAGTDVPAKLPEALLPTEPDANPAHTESPSRMLDLDFSSLSLPEPAKEGEGTEPIIKPPVRYATRSRWPVTKKPK